MSDTVALKVGGSLLGHPKAGVRLQKLLDSFRPCRVVVVAGGGATADVVRNWDQVHRLGDERSHWLAIHALDLNAMLLSEIVAGARLVRNRNDAERAWTGGEIAILQPFEFIQAEEQAATIRLPHHWNATSDSVATWIARVWPADELVLAKSVDPPADASLETAAQKALIDPVTPQLTNGIRRIRWVNLRDAKPAPVEMHRGEDTPRT